MYQPANAPQSIGGVLDDGFRLFRASLSRTVVLIYLGVLAGQIPNLMLPIDGALPNLSFLGAFVVAMVISALFYGAAMVRMNAVARQRTMSMGEALAASVKRLPALLAYAVLYGVILAAGLLLLVVPGIIFGVSLLLGGYVVLLEGKGPLESLRISHNLVWGHWWRTTIILSVGGIILSVAYLLVIFIAGFLVAFSPAEQAIGQLKILEFVVLPVLAAVVSPLLYALMMTTYYDLGLRRSGADLEQRLSAPAAA